jgi:hypothetical protein
MKDINQISLYFLEYLSFYEMCQIELVDFTILPCDSLAGTATRLRGVHPRNRDSNPSRGKYILSLPHIVQTGSGVHWTSYRRQSVRSFSPPVTRQGAWSWPSFAEIKNATSCASTSPCAFMVRCLNRHRDFTFYQLFKKTGTDLSFMSSDVT